MLVDENTFIGYIAVHANLQLIGSLFVVPLFNYYAHRAMREFYWNMPQQYLREHEVTECWGWCTPSLVKYYEHTYGYSVRIKNIGIPYVIMCFCESNFYKMSPKKCEAHLNNYKDSHYGNCRTNQEICSYTQYCI